ncbi:uncharacterized protein N7477_004499 [Penicillium maclennaniae]|uniref:uncharacterized protein n=1 Tax=Penicillium maclennaniae TaxID=1343394 RepID=UPI00254184FE|nr:uncharacterized protein N7477_004499 [Penicillium maclennaniae]KAJ5674565.1 hypothetical protein N7477_004499 [Penicillium maclennaniae]
MRRQATVLGGLDRAALAERRKKLAATETPRVSHEPSLQEHAAFQHGPECTPFLETEFPSSYDLLHEIGTADITGRASLTVPNADVGNIEKDVLIDAYYQNFHKLHPFLPPQRHFYRLCQNPSRQLDFTPLVAVMRLVGHIFHARDWPTSLQDHAEACFPRASPTDPILIQCRLLYSIALFWFDYKDEAKSQKDKSIRLAVDLQMYLHGFAAKHGGEDPVLTESWRRTWWMLYLVDAYYAGTLGTMNFEVVDIETTVELPCEESAFESGNIPAPRSLEDFDCREFTPEITFSSFAYLIGAVRCAASAIASAPKIVNKDDSLHIIQAADSSLDGDIDELMFQAHLLVHVATIGLHRPFSDLKFNAVEEVSSCAREPPLVTPTSDLVNVHTVRVLRAVEAQIRLLALPVRRFHHTPFTTCMVSEGTLALLSACNFLFKERDLATARDQIRMTIGCLKALGEIWPRTARNVREIQTIAHHVLGIRSNIAKKGNTPSSSGVPHLFGGQEQRGLGSDGDSSNGTDMLPSLGSIEDLCGWYHLGDLEDLPWGLPGQ